MGKRSVASWLVVLIAVVLALLPAPENAGSVPKDRAPTTTRSALVLQANLTSGELRVVQDGEVIRTFPLAPAPTNHYTPRGEFSVRRVVWQPRWSPLETSLARRARVRGRPQIPSGRVRITFQDTGYSIHAATDPGSFRDGFTHGCLRLREADLFELARMLIREQAPERPPSLLRRILAGATGTTSVRLAAPVVLTIR